MSFIKPPLCLSSLSQPDLKSFHNFSCLRSLMLSSSPSPLFLHFKFQILCQDIYFLILFYYFIFVSPSHVKVVQDWALVWFLLQCGDIFGTKMGGAAKHQLLLASKNTPIYTHKEPVPWPSLLMRNRVAGRRLALWVLATFAYPGSFRVLVKFSPLSKKNEFHNFLPVGVWNCGQRRTWKLVWFHNTHILMMKWNSPLQDGFMFCICERFACI